MAVLDPVDRIDVDVESAEIFLVAGSFEPRSVRVARLLNGDVDRAVVFNYDDTLDTESGRQNTREIEACLRAKSRNVEVLPCQVSDPFSAVRVFHTYVTRERLVGSVRSVVLDATCFTKLHLLLLLRFLSDWLGVEVTRICYTKPLVYATAFGKELSYGIRKTVYLPYCGTGRTGASTGLIALLGHEPRRLERLVQEIEPDLCVVLTGEPGFTSDMAAYSKKANASLIRRAEYDRHYRRAVAPVDDIEQCVDILTKQLGALHEDGCGNVYLAPLGTKLQALAVDVLSRRNDAGQLSLAYAVPDRYERRSYSQGFGATVETTFTNEPKQGTGIVPIPAGGAVVTDDDVNMLRDELGI
ncbi:MAG: hypothetical protein F4X81_08830 [Gammaproteobacteria bacterium]|nr:hypothetical protein [Gammaproteobacteria bacterium]MXW49120.1 hypothetical protein [Gammaproteobacteria bacterium]MYE51560.1 hypothetical protein [Gammaproteobacteria bacterium]MYF50093.1 hypothetical protein [Gammaproteobacteria bacterium]